LKDLVRRLLWCYHLRCHEDRLVNVKPRRSTMKCCRKPLKRKVAKKKVAKKKVAKKKVKRVKKAKKGKKGKKAKKRARKR